MPLTIGLLPALSFVFSPLAFLIGAIAMRRITPDGGAATAMFHPGEEGSPTSMNA